MEQKIPKEELPKRGRDTLSHRRWETTNSSDVKMHGDNKRRVLEKQ